MNLGDIGAGLEADVGATLGATTTLAQGGKLAAGSAWSTIKVPIAVRLIEDLGGPEQLDSATADQINAALTRSDNDAAAALFAELAAIHGDETAAAEAVTELLREAGDGRTVVSTVGRDGFSTYGQTDWALSDQATFISALAGGCLASPQTRSYVIDLMRQVSSDSWGMGSAGASAYWKGGWGPQPDGRYLLRQMGVFVVDGREVVATLAVIPDDGSFESGQVIATELARRLVARLNEASEVGC